jgi:hypothetical protein
MAKNQTDIATAITTGAKTFETRISHAFFFDKGRNVGKDGRWRIIAPGGSAIEVCSSAL